MLNKIQDYQNNRNNQFYLLIRFVYHSLHTDCSTQTERQPTQE
jgi:hypothetical protein